MNGVLNFKGVNEAASTLYNSVKGNVSAPSVVALIAIGQLPVVAAQNSTALAVGLSVGGAGLLVFCCVTGYYLCRGRNLSDYRSVFGSSTASLSEEPKRSTDKLFQSAREKIAYKSVEGLETTYDEQAVSYQNEVYSVNEHSKSYQNQAYSANDEHSKSYQNQAYSVNEHSKSYPNDSYTIFESDQ